MGCLTHVMWMMGLWTPIAANCSVALWVSMLSRNPFIYSYADQYQLLVALLLALIPTGRSFSFDSNFSKAKGTVSVAYRALLQLQVALVYLDSGLTKGGPTWRIDGTAIYYSLVNPRDARNPARVSRARVVRRPNVGKLRLFSHSA